MSKGVETNVTARKCGEYDVQLGFGLTKCKLPDVSDICDSPLGPLLTPEFVTANHFEEAAQADQSDNAKSKTVRSLVEAHTFWSGSLDIKADIEAVAAVRGSADLKNSSATNREAVTAIFFSQEQLKHLTLNLDNVDENAVALHSGGTQYTHVVSSLTLGRQYIGGVTLSRHKAYSSLYAHIQLLEQVARLPRSVSSEVEFSTKVVKENYEFEARIRIVGGAGMKIFSDIDQFIEFLKEWNTPSEEARLSAMDILSFEATPIAPYKAFANVSADTSDEHLSLLNEVKLCLIILKEAKDFLNDVDKAVTDNQTFSDGVMALRNELIQQDSELRSAAAASSPGDSASLEAIKALVHKARQCTVHGDFVWNMCNDQGVDGSVLLKTWHHAQEEADRSVLRHGDTITLQSWKGDFLHKPDHNGVTTWHTGKGNVWTVEVVSMGVIKLRSWKGDYLHKPDRTGVTTWRTGKGSEWIYEFVGDYAIKLRSWKGDYLHKPDRDGVTTWNSGKGLEWKVAHIV